MSAPRPKLVLAENVFANVTAEAELLGLVLQGYPAAFGQDPELFSKEGHRAVYEIANDLGPDRVSAAVIMDALKRRGFRHPSIVLELGNVDMLGTPGSVRRLIEILQECALARRADSIFAVAREALRDHGRYAPDVVDQAHEELAALCGTRPASNELALVPAATIRPRSVEWAWKDRIPLAMLSLLVGVPGQGKSTTLLDLAARLSQGQLEGSLRGNPVNVAIATAEDALEEVVVPRLMAAGADLQRVRLIRVRRSDVPGGLLLPDDLDALEEQVLAAEVRCLVVDPLVAHLSAALDGHRDQHSRRVCARLAQLAEAAKAAVVALMHLNKTETTDVLTKIGGSVGWGAAARSILILAPDPDDRDGPVRVLAHAKSNVGPLAPALRLQAERRTVERAEDGEVLETSGIAWGGEAAGIVAADLIAHGERDDSQTVTEAIDFLRDLLGRGPVPATDVEKALKDRGIKERAWRKAKRRLGVRSMKVRGALDSRWKWALPEDGQEDPRHPEASNFGPEDPLPPQKRR